jgi:Tfp pilus assembly protein PilZ
MGAWGSGRHPVEVSVRNYIRHPSDIPIDIRPAEVDDGGTRQLADISHGGLAFASHAAYAPGALIHLRITLVRPVFEVLGKVVWCRADGAAYMVGVEFLEQDDLFRARMVEQICYIEHYKNEVRHTQGRVLTSQDAALEWIQKYAQRFPLPDDDMPP